MRDEDKQVYHDLVAWTLDLEVLEEHVEAEAFVGLVDDVVAVEILVALTAGTINLAAESDQREPAGNTALEVEVVRRMLSLSHGESTIVIIK